MGRPTDLTPELHDAIVTAIEAGNFGETAAEANGVAKRTFYEWLARGRGTDPRGDADGRYAQFAHAVEQARARAETSAVEVLRAGMAKDPKLAVEWLRRARHKTWEPGTKVTGNLTVGELPKDKATLLRMVEAELARVRGAAEDGGDD